MPSGEGMRLSRVRENLTHGSLGGRWRRGSPIAICGSRVGVLGSHHDGLVGTQRSVTCYRASVLPDLANGRGRFLGSLKVFSEWASDQRVCPIRMLAKVSAMV